MRETDIVQGIQVLLAQKPGSALTQSRIASELKLKGGARKRLQKCLNALVKDGRIQKSRNRRYGIVKTPDLIAGTVSMIRSGDAFLAPEDGDGDIFIARRDLGTALPGDRVAARLWSDMPAADRRGREGARRGGHRKPGPGDRPSAKVVDVLDRGRRDIVGTLKTTGRFFYVVPIDPCYQRDFYVPDAGGAGVNDRVVVRFTEWDNRHVSPEAEIVDVIGPADDPSVDTVSIIRHYGFETKFPGAAMREAEEASRLVDRPGRRVDLRDRHILTIDPERARDFDDALSLDVRSDGTRRLGVHIADVGHFVRHGSALDREARRRGNSVYLPDKVIPMLPEQLSNGVCSLRPDEDRLAFSAFLTIDSKGTVTAREFAKTIIRSGARLTYRQAMALISNRKTKVRVSPEIRRLLKELHRLAQQLRKKRFARHALDLDIPECEVQIGKDGRMTGVRPVVNDESHQLVEECMIAANEAVAIEVSDKAAPLISRFHGKPAEGKLEELSATLADMGFRTGKLADRGVLARFLKSIEQHPLGHTARIAVLRSMQRAVYSASEHGHYGLAKTFYSHFTSPIRRYPDLVLHRQLATLLARGGRTRKRPVAGGHSYDSSALTRIALDCSRTEQEAERAERDILEIKKYRFFEQQLADQSPEEYEAVVVRLMDFGMFVEVLDLQVQGLVHASALPGGRGHLRRHGKGARARVANELRVGRKMYRLGDRVKVHVVRVDFADRKLDFALTG